MKEIEEKLEKMILDKAVKKNKTIVARYKGQNLIVASGKSSWKQIGHAKLAILHHFSYLERDYVYGVKFEKPCEGRREREKEFRDKLWELIEFVEI